MALLLRPGWVLLMVGVVSFLISRVIGVVPLIGSMIAVMLILFSIFAVIGGLWLIVAERRAA